MSRTCVNSRSLLGRTSITQDHLLQIHITLPCDSMVLAMGIVPMSETQLLGFSNRYFDVAVDINRRMVS